MRGPSPISHLKKPIGKVNPIFIKNGVFLENLENVQFQEFPVISDCDSFETILFSGSREHDRASQSVKGVLEKLKFICPPHIDCR